MKNACIISILLCLTAANAHGELLTLRDSLSRAASANQGLKTAAFEEKKRAENVTIARSGYLPRLDLQGGYTVQHEPQSIKLPTGSITTQEAEYGFFSLSLNQTLYDFGRTAARSRRSLLQQEAAAFEYAGQEKDTFLQVVQAYFGILENRKMLQTAAEEVEQRKEHLRVARNLYEQGVVTRNDHLQAEVKLADSRQRQLDAANRVENGWLSLNFLMGAQPQYRADLEEMPEIERVPATEAVPETAFATRPEIGVLRKVRQAADEDIAESRSGYFPEFYARLGVDYLQNEKVQEQAIYAATVGLRVNLFEGFSTTARQRQAVHNRSQAEERLRLEEERIRLELQMARNDAAIVAERIVTIEQSIRQAEENLRINRDRYSEKVGTATEVLDAQTLLTQVKNEYYRAKYSYEVAMARIRHALGTL